MIGKESMDVFDAKYIIQDYMLKLLIADDEEKVCQLIEYIVDWKSFNIEIVGIANDGGEAYSKILELKPDIVITDIRMPGYDGLQLIQKSKEILPDISFIIISGYSQFEYAHSAICIGVENYLLKPIKKKELEETIYKIIRRYETKTNLENEYKRIEDELKYFTQSNKKNLLHNLLFEGSSSLLSKSIETINLEYSCKFTEEEYILVILRPYFDINKDKESNEILINKMKTIFENKVESEMNECLSTVSINEIIYLLNNKKIEINTLKQKLRLIYFEFMKLRDIFENLNVIIAVSKIKKDISEISSLYREAKDALLDRYIVNENIIFHTKEEKGIQIQKFLTTQSRSDIINCFERMDVDALIKYIQNIEHIISKSDYSGKEINNYLLELFSCLEFGAKSYMDNFNFVDKNEFENKFLETYDLNSIFQWIYNTILLYFNQYIDNKKEIASKPIRAAKQFIHEHYNDKLTLTMLSEKLGFNPTYFSALFKKETGSNFMDYVIQVRMEYAKQLLVQTDSDIYEIAAMVGYTDVKYFMKLFRKCVELSPMEYRKLYG